MKCNEVEKLMLLQDSGETTLRMKGALTAHLHDCASCREFQHALIEAGHAFRPAQEPSAKTMQDILRTARQNAPERKRKRVFGLKPALATASAIAIALGLFLANFNPDKAGMVFVVTETQLLDYEDQMASVMYDGLSEDDLAFNFLMTYEEG